MNFSFAKNRFAGAAYIERVLPPIIRVWIGRLAILGMALSFLAPSIKLFAFLLGVRLIILMIDAYVRSHAYDRSGDGTSDNIAERFTYGAVSVWGQGYARIGDIAAGFSRAAAGRAILALLGIDPKTYRAALDAADTPPRGAADAPYDPISFFSSLISTHKEISSGDILILISQNCVPIKNIILAGELTEEDIRGTALWVEQSLARQDRQKRWWSRARLEAIPGIGKQWAYGRTYYLARYGHELAGDGADGDGADGREDELDTLESVLVKQTGANAILIGDPGSGKGAILGALASRIGAGVVSPVLEDKRIIALDGAAITAAAKNKGETEALLIAILNEAAAAGNIIIAIEAFPEFVASLASLGVNAGQILAPYLGSPALHIIALADTAPFRRIIAPDAGLLAHFLAIYLGDINRPRLIEILESRVPRLEAAYRERVLITYPAIRATADAALDHITEGALPQRAIDLLESAAAAAAAAGAASVLTPAHILAVVSQKTHLPVGAIAPDERAALQNLETTLHARVIGQDAAITAIADTIRRSRTGVRNPRRPIGSFLFLGPTGVGKTESAKALAAVYFGSEERMIRFDMSEYQTEQDIEKLLGSASRNDPGLLAAAVRRTPYAVLLLDEFEKSRPEIRNIFLAILDEGFFTTALGERVVMRDMIIIATSNAGALLIRDMMAQGKDPAAEKNAIIEHIETSAHLAPELLNRFDSLIIFSPLDAAALRAVAGLMLAKLATRLKQQNYILEITPDIANATARGGFDPQFGARPMQRWIQDHIEKAITDGILAGSITPGMRFAINPLDFSITDG